MNDNRLVGTRFEAEFCETLSKAGFWVHNLAQSKAGQPADVIAVKRGVAALIDCKDCRGPYFDKRRIEPNQESAMDLWQSLGNGCGWFAVRFEWRVYMVPWHKLMTSSGMSLR